MKETTLAILIAISLLTGCGGGSDTKEGQFIGSSNPVKQNIIISTNNQSLSISPSSEQRVLITGSNNEIAITTSPISVRVTGNDNTIRIKNKNQVSNSGSGNIILGLNGSHLVE